MSNAKRAAERLNELEHKAELYDKLQRQNKLMRDSLNSIAYQDESDIKQWAKLMNKESLVEVVMTDTELARECLKEIDKE